MSADLLAAFGNPQEQATSHKQSLDFTAVVHGNQTRGLTSDVSGIHAKQKSTEEFEAREKPEEPLWHKDAGGADVLFDADDDPLDEDDFGDFEAAANDDVRDEAAQAASEAPTNALNHNIDLLGLDDDAPNLTNAKVGTDSLSTNSATHLRTYHEPEQQYNANLLDEDYGRFSEPEVASNAATRPKFKEPASPSLGAKLAFGQVKTKDSTETAEEEEWGDFSKASPSPDQPRNDQSPFPQPSPEPSDEEEAWEPFSTSSDQPSNQPPPAQPNPLPTAPTPGHPQIEPHRPTNIPPPSLLLSLLPSIFASLRASLPAPHSTTSPVPSPPSSSSPLHILIPLSHHTSQRLIAGRSLRWKRDTHLSQSMRIGPASTTSTLGGKSGGMKLSSLDRTETVREEREVAEVVEAWREGAWGFNAFLKGRGKGKGLAGLRKEGGRVKVLEGVGVMREKRECALCGLRREERVGGLDDEGEGEGVQDVFGEWWVEYWGHRECKEWWERYREMLRER